MRCLLQFCAILFFIKILWVMQDFFGGKKHVKWLDVVLLCKYCGIKDDKLKQCIDSLM